MKPSDIWFLMVATAYVIGLICGFVSMSRTERRKKAALAALRETSPELVASVLKEKLESAERAHVAALLIEAGEVQS